MGTRRRPRPEAASARASFISCELTCVIVSAAWEIFSSEGYIKKVPIKVINIFTLIQIGALATLWVLKSSSLGILFPLLIALLVPLRQWLSKHFEEEHLTTLDEH